MKHIKHYEAIEDELKQYAIWFWEDQHGEDDYEIIKIIDHNGDIYWSLTIYRYYTESDEIKFVNNTQKESWGFQNNKHRIIFSSYNIDDCLNELETIITTRKYNI